MRRTHGGIDIADGDLFPRLSTGGKVSRLYSRVRELGSKIPPIPSDTGAPQTRAEPVYGKEAEGAGEI